MKASFINMLKTDFLNEYFSYSFIRTKYIIF